VAAFSIAACGRSGLGFPSESGPVPVSSGAPSSQGEDEGAEAEADADIDAGEAEVDEGNWDAADEAEGVPPEGGVDGLDWGDGDGGEAEVSGEWDGGPIFDVAPCRPYADPNAEPCCPGDEPVTFGSIGGSICAPPCDAGQSCPPSIGGGDPQCALALIDPQIPSHCVLLCSQFGSGAECPPGAICRDAMSGGVGVCTYG
jgi:hypothetical protein